MINNDEFIQRALRIVADDVLEVPIGPALAAATGNKGIGDYLEKEGVADQQLGSGGL